MIVIDFMIVSGEPSILELCKITNVHVGTHFLTISTRSRLLIQAYLR